MGDKNVRIAQVNTVDVQDVLNRQVDLVAAMEAENSAQGHDVFLLVITNIIDSDSALLAVGAHLDTVAAAFGVTLNDNVALLPGIVSRKKQVVPPLTEAFSK
ncbi:putative manganese-dependent inorganic pyrophosphatase [bioreactor metagenome]|uniref:Putative manganese-dependent inorganic pyrophosphatase n=1 Tax=bioreactor metagenome TaxID=1076179 RepID=A0A645J0M9_9ZZZZ